MSSNFEEWVGSDDMVNQLPRNISISEEIGVGGQGVVYRGSYKDRTCAVKVYQPGQVSKRIQREVDAMRNIDADGLVDLFWAGELDVNGKSSRVVVTSFVEGDSLDARLEEGGLEENAVYALGYHVGSAITRLWNERIVHRDIKPENIILTPQNEAVVIDLGIARHIDKSSITARGVTWGTRGYLSPEQSQAVRSLTCKSDVFTLAVVMLEAALGRHPTHGDQKLLLSAAFHEGLPEELSDYSEGAFLKRMLHPRPTRRPTGEEVVETLEPYVN
jgi:serine/threonine-protein kinase